MSENIYAVILAGGTGSRMRMQTPKQFLEIGGKPMLYYSLMAFQKSTVDKIVVVVSDEYREYCGNEIIEKYAINKFCGFADNGPERVYSVKNGLDLVIRSGSAGKDDYVLIHDGARPVITTELIDLCVERVKKYGACVPAVPVKDTVKEVNDSEEVKSTLERDRLRAVQTPQCFSLGLINEAYGNWESKTGHKFVPTDDASLVESFSNHPVHIIQGNEQNLKVTTRTDLEIAEIFLNHDKELKI